jgi:hypothetical protein
LAAGEATATLDGLLATLSERDAPTCRGWVHPDPLAVLSAARPHTVRLRAFKDEPALGLGDSGAVRSRCGVSAEEEVRKAQRALGGRSEEAAGKDEAAA